MNTPLKLSPVHSTAERLNAKFATLGGWRVPESYAGVEAELAAVRSGVGLADTTAHGKLQIEGQHAPEAIRLAFGVVPEAIGAHAQTGSGHLVRLRQDMFYLSTPPGGEVEAHAHLQASVVGSRLFVTATDVTHGLSDLRIVGPKSPGLLSKVCGLDFHEREFPNHTAKGSSLAKTRQLVIRRDLGGLSSYSIIGPRSLGAYLWDVLMQAGHEFGIVPIGVAALAELERVSTVSSFRLPPSSFLRGGVG